jgi:hypothetical protein
MPDRKRVRTGAATFLLFVSAYSSTVTRAEPCGELAHSQHPARHGGAPGGHEFARSLTGLSDDERELAILQQALDGNLPSFLLQTKPVQLTGALTNSNAVKVTLCVAPDYLAIGSDNDFLYVPLRLRTAIAIANHYDALLPTRKMVDAIYNQAQIRLAPQPLPAGDTMRTTGYYFRHSELVLEQRLSFEAPLGALTAGDKKDLVLTNRSWTYPERVAIYGWHVGVGSPIQPLSTVHGARYADYSHGVRLVSSIAYVNDSPKPLLELLQDARLAPIVSDEGIIKSAAELLRVLQSQVAGAHGSAYQIEKVTVVRKAKKPRRELRAPFAVNLAHAVNEVLDD